MNTPGRIANELAEIATDSDSREQYRRAALSRLQQALGFDLATLHCTRAGATGYGFDATDAELTTGLSACALAFTPAELQRMGTGQAVTRDRVFTRKRRDVLRDTPLSFSHCAALANWARPTRNGVLGLIAVREHGQNFTRADLSLIDTVTPILTVAERLHADRSSSSVLGWARDIGLTRRQADVVNLVARGLRNREIATALGCSELTVRNHLVVAFRKAGVQTRQELVFQATTHERAAELLPGFAYAVRVITAAATQT